MFKPVRQYSKRKYEKPFKSNSWSDSKTLTLQKIWSCKLIIHYSLSLNNYLIEPVIFHTNCAPGMYGEQNVNSIPTWKLSYIRLAYVSELIKLAAAQNTSFKITLKYNINNTVMRLHPFLLIWCIKFKNTSVSLGSVPQLH